MRGTEATDWGECAPTLVICFFENRAYKMYTVRHKGGIFFVQSNFISLFQSKLTMAFNGA